jgi:DNA end-binding protein Ku
MRPYDPQTGREISREALMRGYEFEPGRFVVIDDRELAELQVESTRNIVLDRFVDPATLDAAFFDTPYYLLPEVPAAADHYALIREAMLRAGRAGIGHIVLSGREWAALVVPKRRGLMLTTLRAAAEVRSEDTVFAEIGAEPLDSSMIEQAAEIIARLSDSFDPRRDFRERFQEALFQLVQAKIRGEKPIFPAAPPVRTIALDEALAASLATPDQVTVS